jgi:hypothetical protein
MQIAGPTPGSQFDAIYVSASAQVSGTLNISVIDGFMPSIGEAFQIISAGAATGNFTDISGLDLGNGASLVLIPQVTGFALVRNS